VLRALDIVVHASTAPEPFGLSVAEAMACGRALVASEAGGISEIVQPPVDALTYPPGGRGDLTRHLEKLAADGGLRQRLGEAAREAAVARLDVSRMGRQMLALYSAFDHTRAAA
jgi:glycosyltransferase involved in cell wall biosynthesis